MGSLEVRYELQKVRFRRRYNRPGMRRLFLIIEGYCRLLVEIKSDPADDGVDVSIVRGVGLEAIPATNQSERKGRPFVDQLKRLDGRESGDKPACAVGFNTRRRERVCSCLAGVPARIPFCSRGQARIAESHKDTRSGSGHGDPHRSDLAGAAIGKLTADGAHISPSAQSKRLDDLVVRSAEWSQRKSCRVVLETIRLTRRVAGAVYDRRVNLAQLVGETERRRHTSVR